MRNDVQRLTTTLEPDPGIGVFNETLREKSIYMVAAYCFEKGRLYIHRTGGAKVYLFGSMIYPKEDASLHAM